MNLRIIGIALSYLFLVGFAGQSASSQTNSKTSSSIKNKVSVQNRIIRAAETFLGQPYVFGGRNGRMGCLSQNRKKIRCSSGIDCQSLIFFSYEKVFKKHWTRFSTKPSVCVEKNQLGQPVQGLAGIVKSDLDQRLLRKADVLFFLWKDYNLEADKPLLVKGKDRYGVWHTGLVHHVQNGKAQVIHAKPGDSVCIEPLNTVDFDALFVVRLH